MTTLSHCANQTYLFDRDSFLSALFVPQASREPLFALYALNIELQQIARHTSEEMIGHIRHAWWQETVEGLYQGRPRPGHPVLEILYPFIENGSLPQQPLIALLQSYREVFPDPPLHARQHLQSLASALLESISPQGMTGWKKANTIIEKHRARYHTRWNGWLHIKLLMAGLV